MNRQEKINHLEQTKKVSVELKPLETKLDEFTALFDKGININDLDALLTQLGLVQSLQTEVEKLNKSILDLRLPDNIQINGLNDLRDAIKDIPAPVIQKIDISVLDNIVDGVGNLIDKIDELRVPDQGQNPGDYVPMRRVVKTPTGLVFDDSFYTGGGGGGGGGPLPFKNSTGGDTQVQLDSAGNIPTNQLVNKPYDYIGFSNADGNGNYQTMEFKVGGSGGSTQVTLTLVFDANNNATAITRS